MDQSADRGLTMLAFSAEPGSRSQGGLQLLAHWAESNSRVR
jgi:hypothetical protein